MWGAFRNAFSSGAFDVPIDLIRRPGASAEQEKTLLEDGKRHGPLVAFRGTLTKSRTARDDRADVNSR
jgi:hypothetical protein